MTTPIIIQGTVCDVLPGFDDNTFDACLCDPPYFLEFMGKDFDRQHKAMAGDNDGQRMYAWHLEWCREVYRVLKPGGFIMSFGGTRTIHRLTCALEDAGFEVRDNLCWLYGSGFPKSLDISKAIDKIGGEPDRKLEFCAWMRSCGLSRNEVTNLLRDAGAITQDGTMAAHFFAKSVAGQPAIATREIFEALRPHFKSSIPLRIEEIVSRYEDERKIIGQDTKARSSSGKSALPTLGGETVYETWDITEAGSNKSALWSGYGTALKPAHEPIILAMKPLDGTFASNALVHGVAGLNIDGGRIGADGGKSIVIGQKDKQDKRGMGRGTRNVIEDGTVRERFPANLILSHHPSCQEVDDEVTIKCGCHPLCPVRLLDEQSGSLKSGNLSPGHKRGQGKFTMEGGYVGGGVVTKSYGGDSGGASRFFYTAKVSTRERNLGGTDCKHPTLKPISLCQYLATLLLPPPRPDSPRSILIPFAGAGSECIGASLAGWEDVVGVEMDGEYRQWAEERIRGKLRGENRAEEVNTEVISVSEIEEMISE